MRYVQAQPMIDAATDLARTQKEFHRDRFYNATFGYSEQESSTLAASGTRAVDFGRIVTAVVVYIEATAAIQVAINGAAPFTIQPIAGESSQGGAPPLAILELFGASITSLTLTNPSSSTTVDYAVYLGGN